VVNAGGSVEGRLFDIRRGIANAVATGEDLVALVAWQRAVSRRASRTFVFWRIGVTMAVVSWPQDA
jgi:hypothetical protein